MSSNFIYKENFIDLTTDKPAREYLKKLLNENKDHINNFEFFTLINQKCNYLFRPDLVKLLLTSDFNDVDLFYKDIPAHAFGETDIQKVTIPNRIQLIEPCAFESSLLEDISFESGCELELIQNNAFDNCNIKSFTCSEGLMHLDSKAFQRCYYLNYFVLNKNVQSIGRACFSRCYQLKEIVFDGTKKEFEMVDLDDGWLIDSNIKKIICIDGDVVV